MATAPCVASVSSPLDQAIPFLSKTQKMFDLPIPSPQRCRTGFHGKEPPLGVPFRVRAAVAAPTESVVGFDEMVNGTRRKYYLLGGKGGVGKTSCAASLAVKFANGGHPTLVVSTDPAHSLSDSFAQINPEKAREEFSDASRKNGGTGVKDFMDGMGLGYLVEQIYQFLNRLIFISSLPTPFAVACFRSCNSSNRKNIACSLELFLSLHQLAHTLRLLSSPDFLDAPIGKILKLKQKVSSATSAIKSVLGQEENRQDAADKLERLRESMVEVQDFCRDIDSTEFVIVTISTVMSVSESSRLHASLKKKNVPVRRLVVNQMLPPSATDCKFCATKRKDQMRAIDMILNDPELSSLGLIQAPLVDVEIRGVPALKFMRDIIWK